jgi:ankyrin repeat protein
LLSIALKAQNPDMVRFLLSQGAHSDIHLVDLVLQRYLEPNTRDKNGETALLKILKKTRNGPMLPMIEQLLRDGANPNIVDENGKNVFHLVLASEIDRFAKQELTDLLIRYNGNPRKGDWKGKKPDFAKYGIKLKK